ncbi:hypothetical protein U1Q18_018552 [Sarracenia purpurea var. burkii]
MDVDFVIFIGVTLVAKEHEEHNDGDLAGNYARTFFVTMVHMFSADDGRSNWLLDKNIHEHVFRDDGAHVQR